MHCNHAPIFCSKTVSIPALRTKMLNKLLEKDVTRFGYRNTQMIVKSNMLNLLFKYLSDITYSAWGEYFNEPLE